MKDSHYTPPNLADSLVSHIKKEKVTTVVDFCVGEGILLKVAKKNGEMLPFMAMIFQKKL